MEQKENGVLIQVVSKKEVERAVMKENITRFNLAYLYLILNEDLHAGLGLSREVALSKEVLSS